MHRSRAEAKAYANISDALSASNIELVAPAPQPHRGDGCDDIAKLNRNVK